MKKPFSVIIASIAGSTGARMEVQRSAALDELVTSGAEVVGETTFEGFLETIEGGVVAEGRVGARWEGECRRCLGAAIGHVDVAVREIFEKDPTEGETYQLEADSVDLELMVREAVMLELPTAAVCREDCAGLCPECGANRNEVVCDCDAGPSDIRWAALDALKGGEPEG